MLNIMVEISTEAWHETVLCCGFNCGTAPIFTAHSSSFLQQGDDHCQASSKKKPARTILRHKSSEVRTKASVQLRRCPTEAQVRSCMPIYASFWRDGGASCYCQQSMAGIGH